MGSYDLTWVRCSLLFSTQERWLQAGLDRERHATKGCQTCTSMACTSLFERCVLSTVTKHLELTPYHSLDEMEDFLITDKGNIALLVVSVQVQSKSISDVYRGILV